MLNLSRLLVFGLCLTPCIYLLFSALTNQLGANPIEKITHFTGDWSLNFLLISLSVTPLRRLTGWTVLIRFRRMLGLYAFFYVCMHFLCYMILDHFFDWVTIIEDVLERPYITVGFTAFLLLIPLAVTSTKKMMIRLGKNWKKLHRIVYLISPLAILHYLWLVKSDIRAPLIYAIIFVLLILLRLPIIKMSRPTQKI